MSNNYDLTSEYVTCPDINLKYTLDRLYGCRDIEIKNLWQRSVFLSVFLTLCFSGYGFFISKIIEDNNKHLTYINYNMYCLGLSVIGIIFSILWIFMAKSSKAWIEIYEIKIRFFEDVFCCHFIPELGRMGGNLKHSKYLQELKNDKLIDNSIFSLKGGTYSPSKINISIGIFSLIIWMFISIIHFSAVLFSCVIFNILVVLFLVYVIYIVLSIICRSGYIEHFFKEK